MSEEAPGPPGSVRVVIVHWNQPDQCAATVAQLARGSVATRVSIVDNGSGADELAALRTQLDRELTEGWVEVIETGRNTGFGPGANVGLRRFLERASDGDWVFVAPHDVQVAPDTLEQILVAASEIPAAGLCCGDVGDAMVPVIDPYFGGMTVPGGGERGWEQVDYPHGTLMGLRRECIEEVGLFDERYFSYCEEADLALRARRNGWQVGLVRGAMATNRGLGSSVWRVDFLQTRNTLLLVQEHSGWYHAFIRIWFTVIQVARGVADARTRPPVFDARARLAGVWAFLTRRFGPPPLR